MITLLFIDGALLFAIWLPSLASALHNMPDGFEDERGFHYGTTVPPRGEAAGQGR